MKSNVMNDKEVSKLYDDIKLLVEQSRNKIYKTVNIEMINLYWSIGKMIVEKQEGNTRAKYGDLLIEGISKRLTEYFGKGFSIQNLRRMRQFYITYPIRSTLMSELSWTHYLELIKIKEENKTVGIIICKRDNKYVVEFCSDERIIAREYELV